MKSNSVRTFDSYLIEMEALIRFLKTQGYSGVGAMVRKIKDSGGIMFPTTAISRAINERKNRKGAISEAQVKKMIPEFREHLLSPEQRIEFEKFWKAYKRTDQEAVSNRSPQTDIFLAEMPEREIRKKIEHARESIRILETNVYSDLKLFSSIRKALQNNQDLKIEILLLWPESKLISYRNKVIFPVNIRTIILNNLVSLRRIAKDLNAFERISVKFYDQIPMVSMFGVDDVWYSGFFWSHTSSIMGPWFALPSVELIPPSMGKFKVFRRNLDIHFQKIWELTELEVKLLDTNTSIKEFGQQFVDKHIEISPPELVKAEMIHGEYLLYFIDSITHELVETSFFLEKGGAARIVRESDIYYLNGKLESTPDSRYYRLAVRSQNGANEYYAFFRFYNDHFKGVYSGVENSTANAGRALAILKDRKDPEKEVEELLKHKWNDELFSLLEEDEFGIVDFFSDSSSRASSSRNNFVIDNPGLIAARPNTQWFGQSDSLSSIIGTYSMYYLSSSDDRMLRKYILEFTQSGRVRVKQAGEGRKPLSGLVSLKEPNLVGRFYREGSPEETIWFLTAVIGKASRTKHFVGILSGFPDYTVSLGRRVFLIREEEDFRQVLPEKFPIGSPEFRSLNSLYPGLQSWLTDRRCSYVVAPMKTKDAFGQEVRISESIFRSACYLAGKGADHKADALAEFRQALLAGYSDQLAFNEEMNGALAHLRSEIIEILDEREDWLIHLNS